MGEQKTSTVQDATESTAEIDASRGLHTGPIRVLSLIEANFVTGPAKSLIEFAASSTTPAAGLPAVQNTVAAFQRPGSGSEFPARAREAGLDVSVISEGFPFDLRVIPQIRSIIATQRPHIVQSMNFKSHFLMRLMNVRKNCRWIAVHHGYTWTNWKNSAYNQLDRWSLRGADAVVTVCLPFSRELQSFGVRPEKVLVQHNSIRPFQPSPESDVQQIKQRLGIPDNAMTLISVGRLSREKAHADLIEATAKIKASHSGERPLRVVIVGDGPEKTALQDRVNALGLQNEVIFAGFQSNVAPFYQLADIVALPSHTEGSPYALLEAMAAGVPVVATCVGGVPEIAKDGETALLVESGQPAALASRIKELMEDATLRESLRRAAAERVLDFNPETYRRNITSLYMRVLAERTN